MSGYLNHKCDLLSGPGFSFDLIINFFFKFTHTLTQLCFSGTNVCETESPCNNGATWVDSCGGYVCVCPPGFKGKDCDEGKILHCVNPLSFQPWTFETMIFGTKGFDGKASSYLTYTI